MPQVDWTSEFPAPMYVCDPDGVTLWMNDAAARDVAAEGGQSLVGTNLLDCHPPAARELLAGMLAEQRTNIYTIEKGGVKQLIYQSPWYQDGRYAGFVEIDLPIPFEMPHFVRQD